MEAVLPAEEDVHEDVGQRDQYQDVIIPIFDKAAEDSILWITAGNSHSPDQNERAKWQT
jgi:hypothetical protein